MRGCRLDQVRRPGPRVADEVKLTRRARLLEEELGFDSVSVSVSLLLSYRQHLIRGNLLRA